MTEPADILDIRDLVVRYGQDVQALHGVALSVAPGGRVGLIGPNGAGKSSLQLAIMGAVHFTGRIVVDGVELTRRTVNDVRGRCGLIFENPDDQLFMPTLLEDVAFGPLNQGLSPDAAAGRAREAIAAVDLAGYELRSAHHMSAGQKRNAALATVLAMNVRLLLLDDPSSGLDFRSRSRLIDLLAGRSEAMLLATHDLELVGALCDRVVLLDAGRIVAAGPAGQILGDPALLRAHGLR